MTTPLDVLRAQTRAKYERALHEGRDTAPWRRLLEALPGENE